MPAGKMRLDIVLKRLWQYILVDFITKLLISRGHNSILVVCNRFLKISHFIVMTETMIAEGLAKLFRNNSRSCIDCLRVILYKGLQFIVELMKELNEMLEIEIKLSIAFHPQTDRQMEKINQELEHVRVANLRHQLFHLTFHFYFSFYLFFYF